MGQRTWHSVRSSPAKASRTKSSSPPRKALFGGTLTAIGHVPRCWAKSSFCLPSEQPTRFPGHTNRKQLHLVCCFFIFFAFQWVIDLGLRWWWSGSWFNGDIKELIDVALETGGDPELADAFTINGWPGVLASNSCSNGTISYIDTLRDVILIANNYSLFLLFREMARIILLWLGI